MLPLSEEFTLSIYTACCGECQLLRDLGPAPLDDLQENTKPHSMMKLDLKIILHISGAGS